MKYLGVQSLLVITIKIYNIFKHNLDKEFDKIRPLKRENELISINSLLLKIFNHFYLKGAFYTSKKIGILFSFTWCIQNYKCLNLYTIYIYKPLSFALFRKFIEIIMKFILA